MTGFYVRHNCYGNDARHNYPRRSVTLMRKGLPADDVRGMMPGPDHMAGGDFGRSGADAGAAASQQAANAAASVALPRMAATRTLESEQGNYQAQGNYPAQSHSQARHASTPNSTHSMPKTTGGAPQGNPFSAHSARPNQGTGNPAQRTEYEVRPIAGVRYPRTSIGASHPRGPLGQVVQVRYRGDNVDLSPLLPCTYPPHTDVTNPEDNDRYHRTSVYAASGLPIDMAAYASVPAWRERVQHQRP